MLPYWLWLTTRRALGPAGVLAVLDRFDTPERAYYGRGEDYEELSLSPEARRSLMDKGLDGVKRILDDCDRLGMEIVTLQDARYPQRLRQIAVPPAVLYVKGKVFRFDEEAAIGIVGTRKPAQNSLVYAERMAMGLTSKGALVISGIAEGIDSSAIRGALKAGGPIVSLLAGGADIPYPWENRDLYHDVAAAGALVSEYPPGTPHKGSHFRPRNRILSGLSLGVLAVECERRSGTMLTVEHALEQGREVYAIPIGLSEQCARGTNWLIKHKMAKLVEDEKDILVDFLDQYPDKLSWRPALSPAQTAARLSAKPDRPREAPVQEAPAPRREAVSRKEQMERFTDDQIDILNAMADKALNADELVERTQIPAKRVLTSLTMLQLDGAVEERPGRRFCALVELEA